MTDSRRDVALLDAVAAALQPPAVDPSAAELFALRTAVASHFHLADSGPADNPIERTPRWRRPRAR